MGIDIETTLRFHDASPKLFTHGEWAHAAGRADSLAGIWCVKEAVVKAVSRWRALHVREVEVRWHGSRPHVELAGFDIEVTISHTDQLAVAVAVARLSP